MERIAASRTHSHHHRMEHQATDLTLQVCRQLLLRVEAVILADMLNDVFQLMLDAVEHLLRTRCSAYEHESGVVDEVGEGIARVLPRQIHAGTLRTPIFATCGKERTVHFAQIILADTVKHHHPPVAVTDVESLLNHLVIPLYKPLPIDRHTCIAHLRLEARQNVRSVSVGVV